MPKLPQCDGPKPTSSSSQSTTTTTVTVTPVIVLTKRPELADRGITEDCITVTATVTAAPVTRTVTAASKRNEEEVSVEEREMVEQGKCWLNCDADGRRCRVVCGP